MRPRAATAIAPSSHAPSAPSAHTAGPQTAQHSLPASVSPLTAATPLQPANSNLTSSLHTTATQPAAAGGRKPASCTAQHPPASTFTEAHARLARVHGTLLLHGKASGSSKGVLTWCKTCRGPTASLECKKHLIEITDTGTVMHASLLIISNLDITGTFWPVCYLTLISHTQHLCR